MSHPENKAPVAGEPLSMALPVQHQAALAERAVPAWVTALAKRSRPFELLLIDDGGNESEAARLASLASRHAEVELIRFDTSRGVGAAIRAAVERARYPLFFYTTLDYPYQTVDLPRLLERIDDVDVVSGFRSARRPPDWYRVWRRAFDLFVRVAIGLKREPLPGWLGGSVHLYNRLTRTVFGQQLDDVDSAYKLFRTDVLKQMHLQSDGPFIHTELIAKANFMTLWMDEVPIGAQGGVPASALQIPLKLSERWRDLRRVLFHPDFGPWPVANPVPPSPTPLPETPAVS